MLKCQGCLKDSGLDGVVTGSWTCAACVDRKRIEERIKRLTGTMNARQRAVSSGSPIPLVPGKVLPSSTTDDEAQRYADENYGIEWTRGEDGVTIWCEM